MGDRSSTELDDAARDEHRVVELLGRVEGQLRRNCVLHRTLDELRTEPVLVVGEPFARVRPVQHADQLLHVHPDDRATSRAHVVLPWFGTCARHIDAGDSLR